MLAEHALEQLLLGLTPLSVVLSRLRAVTLLGWEGRGGGLREALCTEASPGFADV